MNKKFKILCYKIESQDKYLSIKIQRLSWGDHTDYFIGNKLKSDVRLVEEIKSDTEDYKYEMKKIS